MSEASETDLATLRRLTGRIIPASTDYGVPGADDEAIFSDVVETLRPNLAALSDLLASLDAAAISRASASEIDCGTPFLGVSCSTSGAGLPYAG